MRAQDRRKRPGKAAVDKEDTVLPAAVQLALRRGKGDTSSALTGRDAWRL